MARFFGTFGPPHASEPDAIRDYQLEQARKAGWPQLEHDELVFHRFGVVEHRGCFYQRHRGLPTDLLYTAVAAFYVAPDGTIGYLQAAPAGSPQTTAELEEKRNR